MKQLTKHLALLAVILLTAVSAKAYDFAVDGIYYKVTSEEQRTCDVTYGDASYTSSAITIPASVNHDGTTYTVTGVGDYAFANCKNLQSIAIGSVTDIKRSAFTGCEGLTAIDLGDVTSIGEDAFNGCSSLADINFRNATTIGLGAFADCSALKIVVLPNVTTIGNGAFLRCNLTKVELPSVQTIHDSAFSENALLSVVKLDNNALTIGAYAFKQCALLSDIDLSNATSIGHDAFYKCESLKAVDIAKVENLGSRVFEWCKQITIVKSPKLKSVGDECFQNCFALETIDLANVTTIGEHAFDNCQKLDGINLDNVESIGAYGFQFCNSLKSVTLRKVSEIKEFTFCGCESLTDVRLGNVTSIGNWAFSLCNSLENIDLINLEAIGDDTFNNCTNLASISLGKNIKSIGKGAFVSCPKLMEVKILATTPPKLNHSFYGRYETCIVYVPIGAIYVYKADPSWGQFTNIKEFGLILNETDITVGIGKTAQLSVEIIPDDTEHEKIVWTSSNPAIASVNADGVVTGLAEGTAYINVTYGILHTTCVVTVSKNDSVDDVATDEDCIYEVYNLQGVLVRSHCDKGLLTELPCGIYIVKSAQGTRKIRI